MNVWRMIWKQTVSVLSFFHIKCLCGILWKPSGKRQIKIRIAMPMLYDPYFDKDQDGNLTVEHYEGDQYPQDVPVTDYRTFRLEDKKPDAVFIHNPYDQNNRLTSVHPDFYSSRLKKYADQLVYLPYYTTPSTGNVESAKRQARSTGFVIEPGTINADCFVTATEQERELFINILCSGLKGVPTEQGKRRYRTLDHQRLNVPEVRKDRTVLFQKNGGNVFTDLTEPGKRLYFIVCL